MADVWGAFGDSSSDDEDAADSSSPSPIDDDQFDAVADAIALALTQHFATSTKITVLLPPSSPLSEIDR